MTALSQVQVAYADGFDSPRSSPAAVAAAAGLDLEAPELLLGWTPERRPWLASPGLHGRTILAGYALTDEVNDGRLGYLPVRLSALPRLVTDALRPEIAVVSGVRRGSQLVFGASVGWGRALARAADRVVVEIDASGMDLGGAPIEGNVVATIDRPRISGPPPMPRAPSAIDHEVARHVVSILPDEPTLQLGPGGVAEAIMAALDRPVRIWSGLVTDALAMLHARGLVLGKATAAYVWGGQSMEDLAVSGHLALQPVEVTHDLASLSSIERFVGCNTALQIGLDGAVNVEVVGGRFVAGIGGHADFCFAASQSPGGISLIALASTTHAGVSTIVPQVERVSTARSDIEVVVTEHGVADLRGVDDAERGRRMVTVAAPHHRDWLTAALTGSPSSPAQGKGAP